jgi:hypothetical protein
MNQLTATDLDDICILRHVILLFLQFFRALTKNYKQCRLSDRHKPKLNSYGFRICFQNHTELRTETEPIMHIKD